MADFRKDPLFARVVDILLQESERKDGIISHDRLLALTNKFDLPVTSLSQVREILLRNNVIVEGDPFLADSASEPSSVSRKRSSRSGKSKARELSIYFAQIARYNVLTQEEEINLMRQIRAGEQASIKLSGGTENDPYLAELAAAGKRARKTFIESNLKLVVTIANIYYENDGMSLSDMIQEGSVGLMRAIEGFDHTKDVRFCTYASFWIKQSIQKAFCDKGYLLRLPMNLFAKIGQIHKIQQALQKELIDRQPTCQEIAEQLELKPEQVQFLIDISGTHTSLDSLIEPSDKGSATLADVLPAGEDYNPEYIYQKKKERRSLWNVINSLRGKQGKILQLRFGLQDNYEYTLENIGAKMGLTRERIRQIQKKALDKMKYTLKSIPAFKDRFKQKISKKKRKKRLAKEEPHARI